MESRRTARSVGPISSSSHPERRARPAPGRAVAPRKSLGQHFLRDRNIIRRIVGALEVRPDELVLEIGAGPGDLTAELARALADTTGGDAGTSPRLIAVELDRRLVAALRDRFAAEPLVRIVEADALDLDLKSLLGDGAKYVAVGNLPYNAGTAIVRRLLEAEPRPRRVVVMLQKEVAESMLAPAGRMGLLAVATQVYATGRKLFEVAPGSFVPPPKVRSAVVRLDVRAEPLVPEATLRPFFDVVRAGFSAPRKQLRNAVANGLGLSVSASARALEAAGLDPTTRPSRLTVADWLRLARALHA